MDREKRLLVSYWIYAIVAISAASCIGSCVIECRADNRQSFAVLYGETDEELTQLGRNAICNYLYGPVWRDFEQDAPYVLVVQHAWTLTHSDEERFITVAVKNPGWRGRRGDRATLQWDPAAWSRYGKFDAKIVQLKTLVH